GQADRTDRRAHQRQEAADPDRRPRRIGCRDPHRPRTAQPHRRSAGADGRSVPLFRSGDADQPEPQCPRQGPHPARHVVARGAGGLGRASVRGAATAFRASPGQDRRPDRVARRLSGRLSQPRPGDRDHPHRGRAQG
ncbi:hypothetical protein LTR94_033265, partial [Friedmanniomyces endolithicus]